MNNMTVEIALKIIKEKYPDMIIVECLNFQKFYAFALLENKEEPIGGGYITVNKLNGDTSTFNPTDDLQLYMNAQLIDINKHNT